MNKNGNRKPIILVSACLVGAKVRYDGKSKEYSDVRRLLEFYDIIPVCPEVDGGLSVPRAPAEIVRDKVITKSGQDVSASYREGAFRAESAARYKNVVFAILKDNSPACGVNAIYDGSFTGRLIPGQGIAARQLKAAGIKIYSEKDVPDLLVRLQKERAVD